MLPASRLRVHACARLRAPRQSAKYIIYATVIMALSLCWSVFRTRIISLYDYSRYYVRRDATIFRFITDTSWDTLSKVRRTHAPDASERAVKSRPVTSHTCTNFHRTRRFVTPKRNPLRKRFPKAKARPRGYRTEQNSYMRCTLSASHPPRTTLIAVRRPCGAPAAPSAGIVRVSCQCVLTISVTACFITTSVTACLVARGASTSAGVGHLAWKFVCARAHYAAAPASCA